MKYVAKTSLWHTKDEQYIQPGETVDLSHLTKEQVQSLVEMGAIETPAEAKKSAAEDVKEAAADAKAVRQAHDAAVRQAHDAAVRQAHDAAVKEEKAKK